MAQISLWTQSLIKGENIWKKEKENHSYRTARTHARTHARTSLSARDMSFMHTIT